MPLRVSLNILNQKGTPAFYSDIFANRPAFGYAGRVFISTDTGAIYEDTGTAWTLIADAGAGTTGTLQQVTTNGNTTEQGIDITAGGLTADSITDTSKEIGSILFTATGGLIEQDNEYLYWDNVNKRLGIGTTTPVSKLDIQGSGVIATFNGTGTDNAYLAFSSGNVQKWAIGNQYAGGVDNFQIINKVGVSVIDITGSYQTNFNYNVTIAQTLTLNRAGDQLRISSGAIDAAIYTATGNNLLYIGATSDTTKSINLDLSTGKVGIGTTVPSGFSGTKLYSGLASPAETHSYNIGVAGTAQASNSDTNIWGVGVYGAGFTNGATRSAGVEGDGEVTNSSDTGSAVGVRGYATATHSGGFNIGVLAESSGSSTGNYGFYTNMASAANTYANYHAGTANSYFGGTVLIGTTTDNGSKLQVDGNIFSNSGYYGTGKTITVSALNTNTLIIAAAYSGLVVIRDNTSGGSAVWLADPNNGFIQISNNMPGTFTMLYSGGSTYFQKNSGTVPTTYSLALYGNNA